MTGATELAAYEAAYDPDVDFDRHLTLATARRIRRFLRPGERVLELGCATGLMTAELAQADVRITAVERSERFLARARARQVAGADFHHGTVESFATDERFDHVVATQLLNELDDPLDALRRWAELLGPSGLVHLSLANPRSLHRLIALDLGLIDDLDALSERGARLGTRGILDADGLVALGRRAGLRAVHREGVLLKPFTQEHMAALPDEIVEGLDRACRHLPDNGAVNYVVLGAREEWDG